MCPRLPLALAVLAFGISPAPLHAGSPVHVRLLEADTAAIVYETGGRFLTEREALHSIDLTAADREAVAAVRAALEEWGRYTLTERPFDADLLVAVRVGHVGVVTVGGSAPGRSPRSGLESRSGALEARTPYDVLAVYDAAIGHEPRALLWSRQEKDGLAGTPPALVGHLRRFVQGEPRKP